MINLTAWIWLGIFVLAVLVIEGVLIMVALWHDGRDP